MECYHEIRSYKDNFAVWHGRYNNMSFLNHRHIEAELIYVTDGSAQITADGVLYNMQKGDLLLLGSRCIHKSEIPSSSNTIEFILFDTYTVISDCSKSSEVHYLSCEKLKSSGLGNILKDLFSTVENELKIRKPYYQKIVSASLNRFWYTLSRELSITEENYNFSSVGKIEKAIEYIQLNFSSDVTLESAADAANLNPSYFSHIFKEYTGFNFVKYLQIIRINEAIKYIAKAEDKIIDIALDVGFSNVRSFNRVFKELTGYTPRERLGKNSDIIINANIIGLNATDTHVENDSFVVKLKKD